MRRYSVCAQGRGVGLESINPGTSRALKRSASARRKKAKRGAPPHAVFGRGRAATTARQSRKVRGGDCCLGWEKSMTWQGL